MLNERWKKRFTRWFKLRFAILYPLGIWAVVAGVPTDDSLMRSVWIILAGLAIRSWANCYAIKMERLTTSGPYGYVRHPLYLGTFLIMIGFLIMLNVPWYFSSALILIVVGWIYRMTIRTEEGMLREKFGQEYIDYQKAVWALIPRLTPYQGGQKWGASFQRYFYSQEYKLLIWIIILMIVFHLKEELIVEQEPIGVKSSILIAVIILFMVIDAVAEVVRKRAKR